MSFPTGHYHFLQETWWLALVTVALLAAYALQLRMGSERFERLFGGVVFCRRPFLHRDG